MRVVLDRWITRRVIVRRWRRMRLGVLFRFSRAVIEDSKSQAECD